MEVSYAEMEKFFNSKGWLFMKASWKGWLEGIRDQLEDQYASSEDLRHLQGVAEFCRKLLICDTVVLEDLLDLEKNEIERMEEYGK